MMKHKAWQFNFMTCNGAHGNCSSENRFANTLLSTTYVIYKLLNCDVEFSS